MINEKVKRVIIFVIINLLFFLGGFISAKIIINKSVDGYRQTIAELRERLTEQTITITELTDNNTGLNKSIDHLIEQLKAVTSRLTDAERIITAIKNTATGNLNTIQDIRTAIYNIITEIAQLGED